MIERKYKNIQGEWKKARKAKRSEQAENEKEEKQNLDKEGRE